MASKRPRITMTTPFECPPHPVVDAAAGRCMICDCCTQLHYGGGGDDDDDDGGGPFLSFDYVKKGLRIRPFYMGSVRRAANEKLLQQKKLVLVLDVDHTLVHTVGPLPPTPTASVQVDQDQLQVLRLGDGDHLTKCRPMVTQFLSAAATRFDMYLYTSGSSSYAKEITGVLDPRTKYFKDKIISRSDFDGKKSLDLILAGSHLVIVLDDSPSSWSAERVGNVVQVKKYVFSRFTTGTNNNKKKVGHHREKQDNTLMRMDQLLKRIHNEFFYGCGSDVRGLLRSRRRMTLRGCGVLFSERMPPEQRSKWWKMAEEMGARCWTTAGPAVTHVVCCSSGWEVEDMMVRWAADNRKHLVLQMLIE